MGALVRWVLGGHSVLPVLPLVLLGLGFSLDLWGAFGADFCPGPSIGVVGHHRQRYVVDPSLKHPVFRLAPWPALK